MSVKILAKTLENGTATTPSTVSVARTRNAAEAVVAGTTAETLTIDVAAAVEAGRAEAAGRVTRTNPSGSTRPSTSRTSWS